MKKTISLALITYMLCSWSATTYAYGLKNTTNATTILSYQDNADNTTTVTFFKKNLHYLKKSQSHIASLRSIINALKNNDNIPNNTVVIIFRSFNASFYEKIWPILKKEQIPFTLFVNPTLLAENPAYAKKIKIMNDSGLLSLGSQIGQMTGDSLLESDQPTLTSLISKSLSEVQIYSKNPVEFIIYPNSAYIPEFAQNAIRAHPAVTAAFGSRVGPVDQYSNLWNLPTFPMNELNIKSDEEMKKIIDSLPFPIIGIPYRIELPYKKNITISFDMREPFNADHIECSAPNTSIRALIEEDGYKINLNITTYTRATHQTYSIRCTATLPQQSTTYWLSFALQLLPQKK